MVGLKTLIPLLISSYTPFEVEKSVENTAFRVSSNLGGVLILGHGSNQGNTVLLALDYNPTLPPKKHKFFKIKYL